MNNHIECLKYAHENGCDWDSTVCTYLAEHGQLDALKWAHEEGCEWDASACAAAARKGHLEVLKYLHENGCEWYVIHTVRWSGSHIN